MTTVYRLLGSGSAMLVAVFLGGTGLLVSTGRAHGDDPVMHHVKYSISVQNPIYANIYYIDQEPAIFAASVTGLTATPTPGMPQRRPMPWLSSMIRKQPSNASAARGR